MKLSRDTFLQVHEFLKTHLTQDNREEICRAAFHGEPILDRIDFKSNATKFASDLVTLCDNYGTIGNEKSLIILLKTLQKRVGDDKKVQIDGLIWQIEDESFKPIKERLLPFGTMVLTFLGILDGLAIVAQIVQDNLWFTIISGVTISIVALSGYMLYQFLKSRPKMYFFAGIIAGVLFVVFIALIINIRNIQVTPVKVEIISPRNNEIVDRQTIVIGTVSNADAKVFVLVHPLSTDKMWVQNLPVVSTDGTWRTTVFLGGIDHGVRDTYEIIALATVENALINIFTGYNLRNGQVIEQLSQQTNRSSTIVLTRSDR